MNAKFLIFSSLILLGLGSCASGDGDIVRGHYVFGHEVRTLRPCGSDDVLWVIDRSNLLKDLHGELAPGTAPYAEVFVVVAGRVGPPMDEGFGAEYPGALTVERVIYATFEGFGCDFDWTRFLYRAQGNEPFWHLEVLTTGMRLIRPGQPELTWTEVSEKRTGETVVFQGTGSDLPPVELTIEAGPSRDSMSGAYYGLSARLVLNDETFKGSALRGMRAK